MIARSDTRGPSPFYVRMNPTMFGLWVFIAAEALFFGLLIGSYLYLRIRAGSWPPPGSPHLDVMIPAINTFVLLSSGLTMHGAHEALREGNLAVFKGGVWATIALGTAFLLGQAYEYATAGFGLDSGILGSSFFTLTGFHGAHVLVGLIFLGMVLAKAYRGRYDARNHLGVEAAALYWHFVDAVWVVLLTVLYLI